MTENGKKVLKFIGSKESGYTTLAELAEFLGGTQAKANGSVTSLQRNKDENGNVIPLVERFFDNKKEGPKAIRLTDAGKKVYSKFDF